MKFTVVTVVFNAERFIDRTIQSVLEQRHTDVEYIIIDGLSTDNTMSIINGYRGKISKIVSESDQGIYDAMNKGIRLSEGEFVYFLNAGDRFSHPRLLEEVAEFYKSHLLYDVIYGDIQLEKGSEQWIINNKTYRGPIKNLRYLFNNMFCQQRAFFRRSIFDKLGMLNISYKIIADYDLIFRAYQKGLIFGYFNADIVCIPLGGYSNYHLDQFLSERVRSLRQLPWWKWWWIFDWIKDAFLRGSLRKYFRIKMKYKS